MMAFLSDLVLSIFSILPELLRQLPLSGKIAGGNTYPPVRAVSKRTGGRKAWEHIHPSITEVIAAM